MSNVVVTLVTCIRVIGATIDWERDLPGDADFMTSFQNNIDLSLACSGTFIMFVFTCLTISVKSLEFMLMYSAEFSIICQIISFPYFDLGGGASLII